MQPSANASLEAVAREVNALEQLCVEIDAAVTSRDWARLDQALANSRKAMHALENAMSLATPFRDEAFDKAVFERLAQIYAYRHERLEALQSYHDEVGERLRALSRWKSYARSVGTPKDAIPRAGVIDGLR